MPVVKITDTSGADLDGVFVDSHSIASALQKYVNDSAVNFVLLPDLVKALPQPLSTAAAIPVSLKFRFAEKVDLGGSKPDITLGAGIEQAINANAEPGASLFSDELFGSPVPIGKGEGYVSLALIGTVSAGIESGAGNLSFGFEAEAGFGMEYFRRFAVDASNPTVAQALGEVISDFILPADVADLDAMKTGDIATVSGNGSFTVSGDVTLSASANPLASPKLPLVDKTVQVQAGGSIDVGASFELAGSYQIRARKIADHAVELGYYRKKGEKWSVAATASAGVGVMFGKTDLLEKLIDAVSATPEADRVQLVDAGLTADEIQKIQDQIADSIEHSLEASLDLEISASDSDEAAFLYRIDIPALDAKSSPAVDSALHGNLSQLTALEKNDDGHGAIAAGITMLRSAFRNIRERKATLKINLLGLLNFSSVFELIRNSQVVFEPVTGDLTINETVSGTRIDDLILPQAQEQLRKIKFNSLLVTTAYRASKAVSSMQVTSSDVYFAFNDNTNVHTMSDYLDGCIGLGLINIAAKQQLMVGIHAAGKGLGKSTCLLRVEFGDAACEAMFLTNGKPRSQDEYETIGRNAMQVLLQPPPGDTIDADSYRRNVLASDDIWAKLKHAGQPGFGIVLPALASDAQRLGNVQSDYTVIAWWAESMASTARKLADMRSFIGTADPASLHDDGMFISKRKDLRSHVAGLVANSKMQFGLPFGLVALYQAASPLGIPHGMIASAGLTKTFAAAVGASR